MTRKRSASLSNSSRRKKRCADTDTDDDRISDLPDSILSHILSFLPTKNAMATGILSKRWKLLWTTTSNLDFCYPKGGDGDGRFVEFVNYVLILHKTRCLNRFSLTCETGCNSFYVNTWISAALARNVRELVVVGVEEVLNLSIQVQKCIFRCEDLRSLELNCSICISSEIVVSLPRLVHLKLISVYFQSEEAFPKLLDGCPLLKYLVIEMDIGKMVRYGYVDKVNKISFKCIISSTSLTHLSLYSYDKYPGYTVCCGVQLDAPSLRYLLLDDQINSIVIPKRLVFLSEANIQICSFKYEGVPNYCNSFVEAFCAFGHADTLNLSDEIIRALSCATIKMRTKFNRLMRLKVSIDWNYWSSLQDFIQLSDNLEVLIINEDYDTSEDFHTDSYWKKPNVVPRCLSNSLWFVSIGSYYGHQNTLAMVGYILKHGSVLQVMKISFDESVSDFKTKFEMVQKISKFPRKSPDCEVEFC